MNEYWILVVIILLWLWVRVVRGKSGAPRIETHVHKPRKKGKKMLAEERNAAKREVEPQGDPEECWKPRDRKISIQGHEITGGLIYVGEHLAAIKEDGVEPALIIPDLPVAHVEKMRKLQTRFWISYSRLSPPARGVYLKWQADGRRDPRIDKGCLFLFLFGLERRALFDAITSEAARSQLPDIVEEIKRLLSIYEHHYDFTRCALDLLGALQAAYPDERLQVFDPLRAINPGEYPWGLRFEISRMVREDKPVSPEWVMAWVTRSMDIRLLTPARRCLPELAALFAKRYPRKFGEGPRFEFIKKRLDLRYRPLNPAMRHDDIMFKTDLYEPVVREGLMNRFRDLFYECQEELEPYCRELGKHSGEKDALPALAVLPEELLDSSMGPDAVKLRGWAMEELDKEKPRASKKEGPRTAVEADRLLAAWPTKHEDKFLGPEAMKLSRLFEKWGVGVEPDPRFGGPPFKAGGKAVIFELPANASIAPTPKYSTAMVRMHLSALIAAADGDVTEAERRYIKKYIASTRSLSPGEKTRLRAHLHWVLAAPRGLVGVKSRLKKVPGEERRDMGWFLIALAGVDGAIHPDEIKALEKVYRTLDLDPKDVYGHIHTFSTDDSRMDAMTKVTRPSADEAPAPPPEKADNGVSLDMERVRQKMEETARVSTVLETIFEEEIEGEKKDPAVDAPSDGEDTLVGLDAAHTAMLRSLAERPSWSREEFEALALQFNLPPAGVLENLNEAAWDVTEEPLCEDDDPIELDQEVLEEMMK